MDHMAFLSTLDPAIFLYIIKSISEGLAAEGMTNLTTSDATGDSIDTLSCFRLLFHSFCLSFYSNYFSNTLYETQTNKQTKIDFCIFDHFAFPFNLQTQPFVQDVVQY